jgi:hypothetical protein
MIGGIDKLFTELVWEFKVGGRKEVLSSLHLKGTSGKCSTHVRWNKTDSTQ